MRPHLFVAGPAGGTFMPQPSPMSPPLRSPALSPTLEQVRELVSGLPPAGDLLLGCATAAYQVEGGYNGPGQPANNWHAWESRPGNEPNGPAVGFWERPWADLDRCRALGLNAFRLSIEWARVQPSPSLRPLDDAPAWDPEAIARYVAILVGCRQRGLEPVVTLHHFSHPAWVGPDLWLSDERTGLFLLYVAHIVPALNQGLAAAGHPPVRWWITLNEPNTLAPATYLSQWMPPDAPLGLSAPARAARAMDGLYATHVQAYNVIHAWYEQQGLPAPKVSFNNFALDLYHVDRLYVDMALARSLGVSSRPALVRYLADRARAWDEALAPLSQQVRPQTAAHWLMLKATRVMAERVYTPERLPRYTAALESSHRERPLDYVAFDYYDATMANQLRHTSGSYEPWDWAVLPDGLHALLHANASGDLPLMVAENGMATHHDRPRTDGVTRDMFLRAHLFQLLRAVKDGLPVAGYLHWSLTDNYEWGRFAPRFGLFGVDYDHPHRERRATDAHGSPAPETYAAVARSLQSGEAEALVAALVGR